MQYQSDVSYTLPRNLKEVIDKNVEAIVNSSYNTKPMHTGPLQDYQLGAEGLHGICT